MSLEKAVIVDIDGTLADIEHRRHFIPKQGKKKWREFFSAMGKDTVNEWCKWLLNHLNVKRILLTGRPDDYRKETEEWLNANRVSYDLLLMRRSGDFRADTVTKKEIYEEQVAPFYDIIFVVEDRSSVVRMWRQHGLICLQCIDEDV